MAAPNPVLLPPPGFYHPSVKPSQALRKRSAVFQKHKESSKKKKNLYLFQMEVTAAKKTTVVLSGPSLYLFRCLCLIHFIPWFPSGPYRSLVAINPRPPGNGMRGRSHEASRQACCLWDCPSEVRATILLFLPPLAPSRSVRGDRGRQSF